MARTRSIGGIVAAAFMAAASIAAAQVSDDVVRIGGALREPIGPIHWAGAETATAWNGYMDGAVGSGRDAAAAVLSRLATAAR